MKKLNCVMLIDDDKVTNHINRKLIQDTGITDQVIVKEGVLDAVKYLTLAGRDELYPPPALVFLDLNMPGLSGKDFLSVSHELIGNSSKEFVLIFLSSTRNEEEKELIASTSVVSEFLSKPLTESKLKNVMEKYFPKRSRQVPIL